MKEAPPGLRDRLRFYQGVFIDSNILLDISTNDAMWSEWSAGALAVCVDFAPLILNPIIYAEISVGFTTIEALDDALPQSIYRREPLP